MKDEFALDLYHLDEAYLNYPSLTEKFNSQAVEAEIAAMNAKNAMKDKTAFLDQDIRENPGDYGLTGVKLTEGIVSATVNSNQDLKILTEEYYNLLTIHKRLQSKCNTVVTVGKSLEGLTSLHKAGYFASKPICSMPELKPKKENLPESNKTKLRTALNKK